MKKSEIIKILKELEEHLNYSTDEFAKYRNAHYPDESPITWGDVKNAKIGETKAAIHFILNN